jgi:hypothetical protein
MLNTLVSTYYITFGTLQVVSECFPWQELWVIIFSSVELCIVDVFKGHIFVVQWVKLEWGILHT